VNNILILFVIVGGLASNNISLIWLSSFFGIDIWKTRGSGTLSLHEYQTQKGVVGMTMLRSIGKKRTEQPNIQLLAKRYYEKISEEIRASLVMMFAAALALALLASVTGKASLKDEQPHRIADK
jgi:hypothetical protein